MSDTDPLAKQPCSNCAQTKTLHNAEGQCPTVSGFRPDFTFIPVKICAPDHPMPMKPAPRDYPEWVHTTVVLKGIDAKRTRHLYCAGCGLEAEQPDEGEFTMNAPQQVEAPPQREVVNGKFANRYAPNQLLVDAIEWVERQPVRTAIVALLIESEEQGGIPTVEVLPSEGDIFDHLLIARAIAAQADHMVLNLAVPETEEDEDASS